MKRKKSNLRYQCWKCSERFISDKERNNHSLEQHPEPKVVSKNMIRFGEEHRLVDSSEMLNLGDRLKFSKVGVITEIVRVEKESVARVKIAVIEDTYTKIQ